MNDKQKLLTIIRKELNSLLTEEHSMSYLRSREPENTEMAELRNTKILSQIISAIKTIESHLQIDTGISEAEQTLEAEDNNTNLMGDD